MGRDRNLSHVLPSLNNSDPLRARDPKTKVKLEDRQNVNV